eukprot:scaffold2285_cov380-Prasinococcus_capsulatus_cf.AAC.1
MKKPQPLAETYCRLNAGLPLVQMPSVRWQVKEGTPSETYPASHKGLAPSVVVGMRSLVSVEANPRTLSDPPQASRHPSISRCVGRQ